MPNALVNMYCLPHSMSAEERLAMIGSLSNMIGAVAQDSIAVKNAASGSETVLPVDLTHPSHIRIWHRLRHTRSKFPLAFRWDDFEAAIVQELLRATNAPASVLYRLELRIDSLRTNVEDVWELSCEILRSLGIDVFPYLQLKEYEQFKIPSAKRACAALNELHATSNAKRVDEDWWRSIEQGFDETVIQFVTYIERYVEYYRAFQRRPYGMTGSLFGFVPSSVIGLMSFGNLRQWRGLFDNEAGLDAIKTIRHTKLPLAISEKISEMSDPAFRFKTLAQGFEQVYKQGINNPKLLALTNRAKSMVTSIFVTLLATGLNGYVPGPMEPLVRNIFTFASELLTLAQRLSATGIELTVSQSNALMPTLSLFQETMSTLKQKLGISVCRLTRISNVWLLLDNNLAERARRAKEAHSREVDIRTKCIEPLRLVSKAIFGN